MRKRKIIIAIIILIFVEVASFLYVEYVHKEEVSSYLKEKTKDLRVKQMAVRGAYTKMIATIFSQIISKPDVLRIYSKAIVADSIQKIAIRDSLYKILLPTYEELLLNNIRQFIFIMPDNKVFLRFHRTDKYGDDLTNVRYSVRIANETKQIQTGFEEGRTYDGFRNIFPIYYDNIYIGVIEISFSFAINNLFKHDNGIYSFMINKDIVNTKVSNNLKNNYVSSLLSDDYFHEKLFLHYGNDTLDVLKQIDEKIKPLIAERIANNEDFTISTHINNTNYLITFNSIINVEGNPVGYLICYNEDKKVLAEYQYQTNVKHIISSLLFAILIYVLLVVSLRKERIKKLDEEYKEKQKKILDSFKEGIYMITPDYNILYINSIIQNKLNYNPLGRKCHDEIHNNDTKCTWCIYDKIGKGETINYEFEGKNDSTFMVRNSMLEDGNLLAIIEDVTIRKRIELELIASKEKVEESEKMLKLQNVELDDRVRERTAELQERNEEYKIQNSKLTIAKKRIEKSESRLLLSNKTKDKFFSIIAHDLKSPFNSMLGFSDLLANEYEKYNVVEQKRFIEIIHQKLQDTYKLLENLLLWSRSQKGTISYNPETENLFLLSKDTIQLLRLASDNKSIKLVNEISEDIFVLVDENMLSTIIRNLLSNAIKFTPKNGEVRISARILPDSNQKLVEVTIQDNGVGISTEIQSELFEIGENVSTKGTDNESGSGLGLLLCKEFVDKHKGEIWVESKIGEGSKFIFTVPAG